MRTRRSKWVASLSDSIVRGQEAVERHLQELEREIAETQQDLQALLSRGLRLQGALRVRLRRLDRRAVGTLRHGVIALRRMSRRRLNTLCAERDRLRAFLGQSLRPWETTAPVGPAPI